MRFYLATISHEELGHKGPKWSEYLRFKVGNEASQHYFNTEPPEGGARQAVREVLFNVVDELGLDTPSEPTDIMLFTNAGLVSLITESPVCNRDQYLGKTIEEVTETNGLVRITFVAPNSPPPLTGSLQAPEVLRSRVSPGQTVTSLLANTEKTTFEGDDAEPRRVSLADIFKDPLSFHEKRVRVCGYFTAALEHMNLADRPHPGLVGGDLNVWLGNLSTFREEGTEWLTGAVTVDGTFFYGASGHMSAWPGEIVRLTRVVRTTESSLAPSSEIRPDPPDH